MRAVNVLEVVEARDAGAARVPCFPIVEQVKLFVGLGIAEHGVHEKVRVLEVPRLVLPAITEGGGDGQASPHAWRPGKRGTMPRPPFDGWSHGCILDGIALTHGTIVCNDAELHDGCWIDRSSVGLLPHTAHPRLLRLFSHRELVLDVIATRGHLLNRNVLVCDAVFAGAAEGLARAAVVRLGHGAAVRRRDGRRGAATFGSVHGCYLFVDRMSLRRVYDAQVSSCRVVQRAEAEGNQEEKEG